MFISIKFKKNLLVDGANETILFLENQTVINEVKSNELESRISACTDIPPGAREPNSCGSSQIVYNEHIGHERIGPFQIFKVNKVAIFNGI